MSGPPSISIAIPTYRREAVLVRTLQALLELRDKADELIVVDQTRKHEPEVDARLTAWTSCGQIRWLRLEQPSIPRAMNQALIEATSDAVLFLDDDIEPNSEIVAAHRQVLGQGKDLLVAGRVLQPWQANGQCEGFAATTAGVAKEFMGGNFSVPRKIAIEMGGFDENFVRVAYRFESEFACRWRRAGYKILFEPRACIRHLKEETGGTRTFGDHLHTPGPDHCVGEYYYILRCAEQQGRFRRFMSRPLRAVRTRFHLNRPWWIPVTLIGELWGMGWSIRLFFRGPRLLGRGGAPGSTNV